MTEKNRHQNVVLFTEIFGLLRIWRKYFGVLLCVSETLFLTRAHGPKCS